MLKDKKKGFTLIEVLVVMAILAIITAIAIPRVFKHIQVAQERSCFTTLQQLRRIIITETLLNHPIIEAELLAPDNNTFLDPPPCCPSGGEYSLVEKEGELYVICSKHSANNDLTLFGSTFTEISGGFIERITAFNNDNGHYPRSWGSYAYTDLGLEKEDWENPINHIKYVPRGNRLAITPEEDYDFIVTDLNGNQRTLKARYNWNIWYDFNTEAWYFKDIQPNNEVDIETLTVKAD